jgi:tripartite-type tricarboxylate transporter receptor subunit TctC
MMKFTRRRILYFAAAAAALRGGLSGAQAEMFPARPVRLLVGFPPGGTLDVLGHMLGEWASDRLGQAFVVENRPGAASNIAAEAVVRAPADGYTLLLDGSANAINAAVYQNLAFDFLRDIAPVAGLASISNVMEVNPSFPARTVAEFISYAKSNPGKVNFASSGVGTTSHVSAELFKMMAGVDLVHVPYRGSMAAVADLLGGRVQVMFDNLPTSIGFIRSGKLRALAVTAAKRESPLPDVPTVGETVPGYEASVSYGIGAPAKTPAEVIEILNREINAFLVDDTTKERFADMGYTALPGTPADFGKMLAAETEKWAKVVKFADIKPQ